MPQSGELGAVKFPEVLATPPPDLPAQVVVVVSQALPRLPLQLYPREIFGPVALQDVQSIGLVGVEVMAQGRQRSVSHARERQNLVDEAEVVMLHRLETGLGVGVDFEFIEEGV